ncbi:MarR family transcriptional regulator [Paroceanicella profunda]|uniref:MarR family transcriptional regulator n=1 Tax=Paroceanicella profunda TaxID=2579971 RepID=A0A5B8FI74_9RHOB|nr:MarR family transcriptional regulator [Paroceanicella profunda]QDL92788.1 MarR family transcriptional regulator [Paroceanicella profunda]
MNHPVADPCRLKLGALFDQCHALVSSEMFRRMTDDLRGLELSFSQIHALMHLNRHGGVIIADLAEAVKLSSTAASRMVERMVRVGLVQRRENPVDRRQKYVELTPAGLAHLKELRNSTIQIYSELFVHVPDADVLNLIDALNRTCSHMPLSCCLGQFQPADPED